MPKALSLTQNSFAVLALVAIVTVSVITTIGLSPMAISSNGEVAGLSTDQPHILSNFIPLAVADNNDPSVGYTSQLVQLTQSQYTYSASFDARDSGVFSYNFLKIANPNSAPVVLKFSVNVPKEIAASLNINLKLDDNYRLHDVSSVTTRTVQYAIPAGATVDIPVTYELVRPVSFPFQVSFNLEY